VELWSGGSRKALFEVAQEAGDIRRHADVDRGQFVEDKTMFSMEPLHGPPVEFGQGLGISVKVQFDSRVNVQLPFGGFEDIPRSIGTIEFFSAGADWEVA
jgi:hypothetical protein